MSKVIENITANAITLKFHDGTQVRLRGGQLTALDSPLSASDQERLERAKLNRDMVKQQLAEIAALFAQTPGAQIQPLFTRNEEELAKERLAAESTANEELADPNTYYVVETEKLPPAETEALLAKLQAFPVVELAYLPLIAYLAGIHTDIPPITPSFTSLQGYRFPAPTGVDALFAATVPGGLGNGVKVVDVEGAWHLDHEDLKDLDPRLNNSSINIDAFGAGPHGTAVLGIIAAVWLAGC